ncbi:MAG: hypothetical protein K6E93_07505, partial [Bacteroidales bacterium]|nr:hypothetical protein [Bacteroidales bacterium]
TKNGTMSSSDLMSVKVRPKTDFCQIEMKFVEARRVNLRWNWKSHLASTDLSQDLCRPFLNVHAINRMLQGQILPWTRDILRKISIINGFWACSWRGSRISRVLLHS